MLIGMQLKIEQTWSAVPFTRPPLLVGVLPDQLLPSH